MKLHQLISLIATCISLTSTNLYSNFNHFEILNPSHLTIRVKRHVLSKQVLSKELSFFALGKPFRLHLSPGSPVVDAKNFQVKLVNANNTFQLIHVDLDDFYVGTINGNPDTAVDAAYMDGVWSAMIRTPDEVYSIEPLMKHDRSANKRSMIIFRCSDVNRNNATDPLATLLKRPCPSVRILKNGSHLRSKFRTFVKRQTPKLQKGGQSAQSPTVCDMVAVMDTYTFNGVGQKSPNKSTQMLIYWYQLVHRIFKETEFPSFRNMSITLRAIMILTEYTPLNSQRLHFNFDPKIKSHAAVPLIRTMSKERFFKEYCLGHLTTQLATDDNIRGLAILGNKPGLYLPFWRGGICAAQNHRSYNVAFSTIGVGSAMLTDAEYLVILAHEIAHGWGAGHDTSSVSKCAPPTEEGGKYLMWALVNHARYANNFKFSPCSIEMMNSVLKSKAHMCLLPEKALPGVCGNNILDVGEECDEVEHTCCTGECRVKPNKTCSPSGSPCCTSNCTIASSYHICLYQYRNECYDHARCDGLRHDVCPPPLPRPNGARCGDNGRCQHGVCLSYCDSIGHMSSPPRPMVSCKCHKNDMCNMCCKVLGTRSCLPRNNSIRDGLPCEMGICAAGKCVIDPRGKLIKAIREEVYSTRQLESKFVIKHLVMFVIGITVLPYLIIVGLIKPFDDKDESQNQRRVKRRNRSSIPVSNQQDQLDTDKMLFIE